MEIIISSNTSKPIDKQITSQIKAMIMSAELQTRDERYARICPFVLFSGICFALELYYE